MYLSDAVKIAGDKVIALIQDELKLALNT